MGAQFSDSVAGSRSPAADSGHGIPLIQHVQTLLPRRWMCRRARASLSLDERAEVLAELEHLRAEHDRLLATPPLPTAVHRWDESRRVCIGEIARLEELLSR